MNEFELKGNMLLVFNIVSNNTSARVCNDTLCRECEKSVGHSLNHESIARSKRKLFEIIRNSSELFQKYGYILPDKQQQAIIEDKEQETRRLMKNQGLMNWVKGAIK